MPGIRRRMEARATGKQERSSGTRSRPDRSKSPLGDKSSDRALGYEKSPSFTRCSSASRIEEQNEIRKRIKWHSWTFRKEFHMSAKQCWTRKNVGFFFAGVIGIAFVSWELSRDVSAWTFMSFDQLQSTRVGACG